MPMKLCTDAACTVPRGWNAHSPKVPHQLRIPLLWMQGHLSAHPFKVSHRWGISKASSQHMF